MMGINAAGAETSAYNRFANYSVVWYFRRAGRPEVQCH